MYKTKLNDKNQFRQQLIAIFIILLVISTPFLGWSGTGSDQFSAVETTLTNMINGGLGKVIAITALGFALIGSVLKFNPVAIAGALGIGIVAGLGTTIVTAGITALI